MLDPLLDNLSPQAFAWGVALLAASIGAATDTFDRRLPNWLTVPVWTVGLAFAFGAGGLGGLGGSLLASVLCATPFVALFLFARGGAGDAKMMAAVGAWVGLSGVVWTLMSVTLAGAALGIVFSLMRREGWILANHLAVTSTRLGAVVSGGAPLSSARDALPAPAGLRRFPYGIAILAGVAVAAAGVQPWNA